MWGFSGTLNLTAPLNSANSLLNVLHYSKRLCSSVHISAMTTVQQNLMKQYELTIIMHVYMYICPMKIIRKNVTSVAHDFYQEKNSENQDFAQT